MSDRERPLEITRADVVDGSIAPLLSVLPTIVGLAYLAPWLVPVQVVIAVRSSALVRTRLEDIEAEVRRLGSERPEVGKALADLDALAAEITALRADLHHARIGRGGTAELEARLVELEQRESARFESFRIGMSAITHAAFADAEEVRRAGARFAGNVFAGAPGDQATLAALSVLPSLTGPALRMLEPIEQHERTWSPKQPTSMFLQGTGIEPNDDLLEAMESLGLIRLTWLPTAPAGYRASPTAVGRKVRDLTR